MELEPREGTFLARIKALESENTDLRRQLDEVQEHHQISDEAFFMTINTDSKML